MSKEPMVVNLESKLGLLREHWSPRIVARMNDIDLKIAKLEGEFVWHSHPETDEVFYVLAGELLLRLRDRDVELRRGELYVVPKGVEHKPVAEKECSVLLIEPAGTVNTGDAGGELTAAEAWL